MRKAGNIAIVGAGMAGLSAARVLTQAGQAVTLFDKGQRAGGRLATRHVQGFTFNHGCQFFTARDAGFAAAVNDVSARWDAIPEPGRMAGVPDMAAIAARFSCGLEISQSAHARRLSRAADGWRLHFDDRVAGPFDTVILAIPAPQAAALLAGAHGEFEEKLQNVHLAPCWAVMLGFAPPPARSALEAQMNLPAWPEAMWAAWRGADAAPVAWAARENTRPGAKDGPPAFTFHFSAGWSAAHLEDRPEEVIDAVLEGPWIFGGHKPVYAAAHRWRHALAAEPLGEEFLWDEDAGLGLCGDWCIGGRLEAAYLSGRALGIRFLHDQ